jgi:uncharacterized YccA/Bax inhibitor family protein
MLNELFYKEPTEINNFVPNLQSCILDFKVLKRINMEFFKSGNPTLGEKAFQGNEVLPGQEAMTVRGTINKFMFMLLMIMAAAVYTWNLFAKGGSVGGFAMGGAFGGFIVAMVIIFKKEWSPYLAPLYGLLEGLFLGGISAAFNAQFKAIAPYLVIQAVLLTFGVVIAMYVLYSTRLVKVTDRFRMIIFSATGGIAIFYVLALVLGFFHINIPFINQGTPLGIIFSLVVVAVAALNLLLDFDMIEKGAQYGAPKYMEWYGAFGLMITIVWLYLEILRLLAKLSSQR